ncbi:MAG: transporter permease, partial [Rhizobacter sp.]|nr:transporter permease [Rhizobacter sp.]
MKLARPLEVAVVVLLVAAPAFVYPILLAQVLCMALLACSVNLLFGYAGLLSFGHSAFFGIAAYACGVASKEWGLSTELSLLVGTAAATALGAVFGLL